MRPTDLEDVIALEARVFPVPNRASTYAAELKMDVARLIVARDVTDDRLLAYANFWIVGDECELHTIAVDPSVQGARIGRALLLEMEREARMAGASLLLLDVRESNARARALYGGFGFDIVGRRRAYYADSQEDAILMRKFLPKSS